MYPHIALIIDIPHVCCTEVNSSTVEPPKEDTPRRGQCIKYLSIKDTAFVPKFTSLYKLYIKKPLKEDNLSTRDKTAEFILVPKCPLFGGSTVYTFANRGCVK